MIFSNGSRNQADIFSKQFTLRGLVVNLGVISLLLVVNRLGAVGNVLCYAFLFWLASRSTEGALKALGMSGFLIMANPFIVKLSFVVTLARFFLLLVAAIRVYIDVLRRCPHVLTSPLFVLLAAFCFFAIAVAPINGYFTLIAVLKAGVFGVGAFAILMGAEVNRSSASDLAMWYLAMIIIIIMGSYATIPLGISVVYAGEVFYGTSLGRACIASHPQTLGVILALSVLYLSSLFFYSRLPWRWLYFALIMLSAPLVWLTRSRTAMIAIIVSGVFTVFVVPLIANYGKTTFKKLKLGWIVLLAFAVVPVGFLADHYTGGNLTKSVSDFAFKGKVKHVGPVFLTDMASSREELIRYSWQNFLENPLTGINFGTEMTASFAHRASFLSASAEKGFLPTGILEEVGLIGTLLFVMFLSVLYYGLYQNGNILGIIMVTTFLVINLGEMIFFSFGGVGLYCWSLIAASITIGYRHKKFSTLA